MASEEKLRNELERIQRKLSRDQQTEQQKEESLKRAKIKKLYSRLDFLSKQTPETIHSSIVQVENKQLLLQGQIAELQGWNRFYHSLLETRDEQIEDVQSKIDQLEGRTPSQPKEPTVESIKEQWAFLQKLLIK